MSGDGKVLFWTLENSLRYPVQGFRLTPATKRKGESRAKRILAGGTALSFTHEGKLSSSFVVGSEGGGVYRCLLRHRGGAASKSGSVALASIKTDLSWENDALLSVSRMPPVGVLVSCPCLSCFLVFWLFFDCPCLFPVPGPYPSSTLNTHPPLFIHPSIAKADRSKVIRHVERFAREAGIRTVTVATIYDAKPEGGHMFPNPVDFKYQPHVGPVQAIDTSPFHRNLFLSCGADGRVSVFSVLQTQPLMTLEPTSESEPLFVGAFSRVRPLVFAVAGSGGAVHLYDLQRNSSAPVQELSVLGQSRAYTKAPTVLTTSFNPKQRRLLAAGDASGNVHVWRLGWQLSTEQPRERAQLDKLAGVVEGL